MAQVSFNVAKQIIQMGDGDHVRFGTVETLQPYAWSWITPTGDDVDIVGTGLAYDPSGRAVAGKVNEIQIDLKNNDFLHPDILIKGLNVDAWWLDNSPDTFWHVVLGGDDVIDGSAFAAAPDGWLTSLFGDAPSSRTGSDPTTITDHGGNDRFVLADAVYFALGDVDEVTGDEATGQFAVYQGGNDLMTGVPTHKEEQLIGDAARVGPNGVLHGGDDVLQFANDYVAVGDANMIEGHGAHYSVVFGGDDRLEAGTGSKVELAGDVFYTASLARVEGGDDTIFDSEQGNRIAGDLAIDRGDSIVVGGADRIFGRGGDDVIAGDVRAVSGTHVTGGNDVIYGGTGNDTIWGEQGSKILNDALVSGGNDQLFGDEGDDKIYGQTGNDTLFGGLDRDLLDGGKGNDLLDGGNGDDQLFGGAGKDRLRGGLGNDKLTGGSEADIFEATGTFGRDQVLDFKNGTDKFDVDAGLTFKKLVITAADLDHDGKVDDVSIGLPGGTLEVLNTAKSAIDAGDFLF
ncbi:MAG: calcium-binding protein [Geminicoccaceae bacterium]